MGKPNEEKPAKPVADTYAPLKSERYTVGDKDSWGSLATKRRVSVWDLIDFNFPGLKALHLKDHQRASREVNWYLREYVGCEQHDNENYRFSAKLTKGRGVHQRGVVFLPLVPEPAPAEIKTCKVIDIPSHAVVSPTFRFVLNQLGVELPTRARCLHPQEIEYAKVVYGKSLAYDDIYISDAIGASGRPVTVAVPVSDKRWVVALNVGSYAFENPPYVGWTLIHELAHAWQSQHYTAKPYQFMVNCVESQLKAEAASLLANKWVKRGLRIANVPSIDFGRADAYSYVPGSFFHEYAGEQIAQQVEDYYKHYRHLSATARGKVAIITEYVKRIPAGVHDSANELSLSKARFAFEKFPDVVWHE